METNTIVITNEFVRSIHNALHHSTTNFPRVDGKYYTIHHTSIQKLKYIQVTTETETIRFTEQNPNTSSYYAVRARNGEEITWGIRDKGKWIYIDSKIIKL